MSLSLYEEGGDCSNPQHRQSRNCLKLLSVTILLSLLTCTSLLKVTAQSQLLLPFSRSLDGLDWGLALIGLLLELSAPSLELLGFCSLASSAWLTLALDSNAGLMLALWAAPLALCARTLWRSKSYGISAWAPALSDWSALSATLLLLHLWRSSAVGSEFNVPSWSPAESLLAIVAFTLANYFTSNYCQPVLANLSQSFAASQRYKTSLLYAASPILASLTLILLRLCPPALPLAALLLGMFTYCAYLIGQNADINLRGFLQRRLRQTSQGLKSARQESQQAHADLQNQLEECSQGLLLTQSFAQAHSVEQAIDLALHNLRFTLSLRPLTLAVFRTEPDDSRQHNPLPLSSLDLWPSEITEQQPPVFPAAEEWQLMQWHNRLVEETSALAWSQDNVLQKRYSNGPSTTAPDPNERGHRWQLAWPLEHFGVLYAGTDCQEGFDGAAERQIQLVGLHLGAALRHIQLLENQNRYVAELEASRSQIMQWNQRLETLSRTLGELLQEEDSYSLVYRLKETILQLLPAEFACVLLEEAPDQSSIQATVCRNRAPLLIGDLSATRFSAPAGYADSVSLLAVPLPCTEHPQAVLLAGSRQKGAFSRPDQEALTILANQAGTVLNVQYIHRQLQETHETLKKSQSNLIQSGKLAAVGRLASGIAHELNTPLGSITLGLDSALNKLPNLPADTEPSPVSSLNIPVQDANKIKARLQSAKKAALYAKDIVAKLLFYAREAHHGTAAANLNEIIKDTLDLTGFHLRKAHIAVQTDLMPDELAQVCVNRNEIQQVLTNLLMNALDALDAQPVRAGSPPPAITISTAQDSENSWTMLSVSDNGPGIAESDLPHIFDPFYTSKPVGQGTGLGLSVSREIAERHNGQLELSRHQAGCTFTLRLPSL